MQNLATKLRGLIMTQCSDCFSLYAGYGMKDGEYIIFPKGEQIQDKRNTNGRCLKAVYKYADNSKLTYKYNTKESCFTLAAS